MVSGESVTERSRDHDRWLTREDRRWPAATFDIPFEEYALFEPATYCLNNKGIPGRSFE